MDAYVIGQRIRAKRKALGISQQELAEAVGYTDKGMISRIESGKIALPMGRMVDIATALHTPVSTFFDTKEAVEYSQAKIKVFESLDHMNEEQIKQVMKIIDIVMKGVEQWQPQNGTDNDGDSESRSTV